MKTFSSFLPRLGEHGYIHVSTAELCQSIIAEEAEQWRFVTLRQIMQQCRDLLRAFRRKSEVNRSALRSAVDELEKHERHFFSPLRVTYTGGYRETERILPQWSRLILMRRQLAPLIAATNVELTRLGAGIRHV